VRTQQIKLSRSHARALLQRTIENLRGALGSLLHRPASGWPVAAGTASSERDAGTSRIEPPSESVICPPRFISAWLCQRLAAPGDKVPKLQ